jgi:nucleosome binding factor SPN SPT16 subunit
LRVLLLTDCPCNCHFTKGGLDGIEVGDDDEREEEEEEERDEKKKKEKEKAKKVKTEVVASQQPMLVPMWFGFR